MLTKPSYLPTYVIVVIVVTIVTVVTVVIVVTVVTGVTVVTKKTCFPKNFCYDLFLPIKKKHLIKKLRLKL